MTWSGSDAVLAAISDDARWFVALAADGTGRVLDAADRNASTVAMLGPGVKPMAVSRDGRWVAAVGPGNAVRIWDVRAARWLGNPLPARREPSGVVFSPDGEVIAIVEGEPSVRLWRAATGEPIAELL